ncbi:hypothetical protein Tco_1179246 [Tanacetum coccineum]
MEGNNMRCKELVDEWVGLNNTNNDHRRASSLTDGDSLLLQNVPRKAQNRNQRRMSSKKFGKAMVNQRVPHTYSMSQNLKKLELYVKENRVEVEIIKLTFVQMASRKHISSYAQKFLSESDQHLMHVFNIDWEASLCSLKASKDVAMRCFDGCFKELFCCCQEVFGWLLNRLL